MILRERWKSVLLGNAVLIGTFLCTWIPLLDGPMARSGISTWIALPVFAIGRIYVFLFPLLGAHIQGVFTKLLVCGAWNLNFGSNDDDSLDKGGCAFAIIWMFIDAAIVYPFIHLTGPLLNQDWLNSSAWVFEMIPRQFILLICVSMIQGIALLPIVGSTIIAFGSAIAASHRQSRAIQQHRRAKAEQEKLEAKQLKARERQAAEAERQQQKRLQEQERQLQGRLPELERQLLASLDAPDFRRASAVVEGFGDIPKQFRPAIFQKLRPSILKRYAQLLEAGHDDQNLFQTATRLLDGLSVQGHEADYLRHDARATQTPIDGQARKLREEYDKRIAIIKELYSMPDRIDERERLVEAEETRFTEELRTLMNQKRSK